MSGTVTRTDAFGNEVEVRVGVDGVNPVSVNNPLPKSVTGRGSRRGSQPFEGSLGDGQSLLRAALGDPGHPDPSNTTEAVEEALTEPVAPAPAPEPAAPPKVVKKAVAKPPAKKVAPAKKTTVKKTAKKK